MSERLVGAIEGGGTKFRVAVGASPDLVADATVPTTDPESTIGACIEFLREHGTLAAVGIAMFGPLDLDPGSHTYGSTVNTPKPGWSNIAVKDMVESALGVPVTVDVDVAGAALGELRWGAGRGLETFVFLTIGTGIGGGLVTGGNIHRGLSHPEMGHVVVAREPDDDFAGICPFHQDCFEGMAAGPAISARWGAASTELVEREEVWDLEARYIAQALRTIGYVVSPQRFIVGGGVLRKQGLLEQVRTKLVSRIAGYGSSDVVRSNDLTDYVVAPELGQDAGLIGAIALAQDGVDA